MSDSPTSSPPAPPADSGPPPDNSTGDSSPPPTDSAPPPSPPADSSPPPSLPPPPPATPPPESDPPPADSPPPPSPDAPPPADLPPVDSGSPPPEPANSPPPPSEEFESPPPPPPPPENEDNTSPPPPPDPATPPKGEPKKPKKSPPPPPPSAQTTSPPAPPKAPSPPVNASQPLPPKSTSRGVPSFPPPPPASNDGGYEGKTMAGMAVAGLALLALIAVVFLVRRKKKKNVDVYDDSQYLPPSNFSIKSDGFLYGQNTTKGGGGYPTKQQSNNSFGGYTQSGSTPDSAVMGSGQTHFSYEELMEITQGFSKQNILGEGGFGCVYKGKLHDGKLVAVKQLKVGSGQGDREFKAEVEIISRVHHRHLVSLVGYCISDVQRLLIYEYVPNQTLEHHLHGKGRPVLEWTRRVRIAIGSAKGLAYLHEDCHPKIIHRDIKSANILLDDEFEAQVADFGLAKLSDSTQTHVSTRVMGTFGYLAPEYAQSGKLTDRSDVFSFGVVLLELITGRRPVDQYMPLGEESLVEWARPLLHKAIDTGDFSDLVDRRLENNYVENEVFRMIETAAACVRHSGPKRPRMAQVVRALDSEGDMGDISNGYKVGQNSSAYDSDDRKMAFGFDDSSDSGMHSGDYSVQSSRKGSNGASTEFTSENRKFNNRRF
ncbi:unnamed protein product [Eruca vesicaria subsp. sativa]|uniref:non-specific serine/threonine protein kinase n=1 Tax=Eruca vesicaria subsp. sativa TaxID=29727 RepID=A0ABC8JW71_ERUVS|nr:unnamed protein product [Eruca vesicaria subsp. sativa]